MADFFRARPPPGACLADTEIVQEYKNGNIVIYPFSEKQVSCNSYDVTLGKFYYRAKKPARRMDGWEECRTPEVYNPWDEANVREVWGEPQEGKRTNEQLVGISPNDLVIWIDPGERILAHTHEFIGGRNLVTAMLKTRSSYGRSFISTCQCAGLFDVGFYSRCTMEISNHSAHYRIPLVVGRRIAQVVFFRTGICKAPYTVKGGKYQPREGAESAQDAHKKDTSAEEKEEKPPVAWQPSDMLPKLYLDA